MEEGRDEGREEGGKGRIEGERNIIIHINAASKHWTKYAKYVATYYWSYYNASAPQDITN